MQHVAVGIVKKDDLYLISTRPSHCRYAGYYEFPGGKVEPNESSYAALCRELKEEVGVEVLAADQFMQIEQKTALSNLNLIFWMITSYDGEAHALEGQQLSWVSLSELKNYKMLPANQAVLAKLRG